MSLRIDQLRVRVGSFVAELAALEVQPGQVCAWTGPSGCGKTTLLHGIAGFVPIERGTIGWDGRALENIPPEQRRIAMVFQRAALFPHLSVAGNVEFPLRLQKKSKALRRELAQLYLERVGLGALADRRPHQLSEGQAQRVALARALAADFPILLLDEPFSSLDPVLRIELRILLQAIVREKKVAAILVTHHEEDAQAIGDTIVHFTQPI